MIFVTVGTTPFNRLVKIMDNIAGRTDERIIMQIGHSEYKPKNAEYFDFIGPDKFKELNREARIVVCHGGVGSIINALTEGKSIIAVPRIKELSEMVGDDHQLETLATLGHEGLIEVFREEHEIEEALKRHVTPLEIIRDRRLAKFIKNYLISIDK